MSNSSFIIDICIHHVIVVIGTVMAHVAANFDNGTHIFFEVPIRESDVTDTVVLKQDHCESVHASFM